MATGNGQIHRAYEFKHMRMEYESASSILKKTAQKLLQEDTSLKEVFIP